MIRNIRCFSKRIYSRQPASTHPVYKYGLLAIPICAFGLGFWQISRKKWKSGLIDKIKYQAKSNPIYLDNQNLMDMNLPEYSPVKLMGIFDYDKEVFIGPRLLICDSLPKGLKLGNKVGYNVITPMRRVDSPETILVNRGWIPKNNIDYKTEMLIQPSGPVEIEGLIRKSEERSFFSMEDKVVKHDNDQFSTIYNCKQVSDISKALGTSEVLVDMKFNPDLADVGGPIGGQTRLQLRDEHMQYIITWFGFGAVLTFMWVRKFLLR